MGEPAQKPSYTELFIHTTLEASDGIVSLLFDFGAAGVIVEGEDPLLTLRCHFPSDEGLDAKLQALKAYLRSLKGFGLATGRGMIVTQPWEDTDWATKWKEHFQSFQVGKRFVVKPSWEEGSGEEGGLILEIDPGMAFGTGAHATTKMCLEFLEEVLNQPSVVQGQGERKDCLASDAGRQALDVGLRVLDLGTGSGILAIAAAKLGAGQILALDLDPEACRIARENVGVNRVGERIQVQEGTLVEGMGPFDLIVANLSVETILPLLPVMRSTVSPGGRLILAGTLEKERFGIRQALAEEGLQIVAERTLDGWVTYLIRNP